MNHDQYMIDTLKHEAIFNNLFSFSYGSESKVRVDATLFEIIKMSLPIMHKLIRDTPYGVQKFTAKLFAVTLLGEEYVNNLKEDRPLYDEFCHCLEIAYIGLLIAVYDNLESLPNDDWHVILENYPEFGDEENPLSMDINEEEKYKLTLFRYVMKLAQLVIPPKNNKGRLLEIVTRITEGYGTEYKTGSGQTKATARRVVIYEREGGVVPIPKRRKGHATSEDGSNTPADTPRTARSSANGEYVDTARSGYDRSTDSQSRLTLEAGEHSPDSGSVNNNSSYANSSHASSPTSPHHKLPQHTTNNATTTSFTAATQFNAASNGIASPVSYPVEYQYQYQQPLQPMQPPLTAIQLQQQQQQFPLQSLQHQQLKLFAPPHHQQESASLQLYTQQQQQQQQQQQPNSPLKIIPVTEANEDNTEMLIDDFAGTAAVTDGAANALLSMAMELDDFEGSVLGQSRGREGMTRSRRYSHDSSNIFSTESQKGYFLSLFTSYGSSRRDLMNHSHSSITAMNTYNNTHTNPNPSSAYNSSSSHNNSNNNVMNGNSTHSMLSAMMEADGYRLNSNNYNNNNNHHHANNNYPSYTTNLNNSGTTTSQIPTAGITAGTVNSRDKMCSSKESMMSMISGLSAKDHSPRNSWNKNTFNYYTSSPNQVMQHLQQQQQQQAQQQAEAQLQQQIQSQNNFYQQQQQQLQPDPTITATATAASQQQQQQHYTLMSPPKSLSFHASSFLPFYSSNSNNGSSSAKSNSGGNDNSTNTSANAPNSSNVNYTNINNNTNNNTGDQNIRNSLSALTKNIFSFAAGGSSSGGSGAKSPR